MSDQSVANAIAFAEYDFPVFSVWGVSNEACLCPAGKTCTSPGKHPIPRDGLKAGTTDVERVKTMLAAAGSQGQYGIVPAPNVVILDVDGEGWEQRLRELGLPKTLAVKTANGVHLYFHWPEEYGPQPTRLFGWVVRSEQHPGYVIGPGSIHVTGIEYRFVRQGGQDTYAMIAGILRFPHEHVPTSEGLKLVVSEGARLPETILEGSRHDFLRDRARTLRGGGLTGDDLFNAVSALNRRLPQPKTDEEIRRAIGEVETKFSEDPVPLTARETVEAVGGQLFVNVEDYRRAQPTVIEWVSPIAALGFVSLVAGPPKAGKSTLVSNLLWAREHSEEFLWGSPVPAGPSVLVTEEGGMAVVRKTEGLTQLDILDRKTFVMAGLRTLDHLLAALLGWCETNTKALVIIDTLAIWGDIEDENDATHATKAIAALAVLAQAMGCAVLLVHHSRKGGGDHGEGIRGSGAIFGTVDQAVELSYATGRASDDRKLDMTGRLTFPETRDLIFDRATNTYSITNVPYVDPFQLDQFPVDGSGHLLREDAEGLWGLSKASTNKRLSQLVADGKLVSNEVHTPGDKLPHREYSRPKPLLVLDNRSVSGEMADIFAKDDPE